MPAYPPYSSRLRQRLVERSLRRRSANEGIQYPASYLVHSHFMPGGYLSPLGATLYDRVIRPMYSLFRAGAVDRKVARLVAHEHPGGRVLDIGCGGGHLLRQLARVEGNLHVTGLDLSPVLLDRAAARLERHSPAALIHGRTDALPFEGDAFDAITVVHVAGHLSPEESAVTLAEALRVLKPGGKAYLVEHPWHRFDLEGFEVERRQRARRLPIELLVLRKPG